MNFTLPWMPNNDKFHPIKTPVAFFMGGALEHDELCCLWKPNSACMMCDINSNHFDDSKQDYELCDIWVFVSTC